MNRPMDSFIQMFRLCLHDAAAFSTTTSNVRSCRMDPTAALSTEYEGGGGGGEVGGGGGEVGGGGGGGGGHRIPSTVTTLFQWFISR